MFAGLGSSSQRKAASASLRTERETRSRCSLSRPSRGSAPNGVESASALVCERASWTTSLVVRSRSRRTASRVPSRVVAGDSEAASRSRRHAARRRPVCERVRADGGLVTESACDGSCRTAATHAAEGAALRGHAGRYARFKGGIPRVTCEQRIALCIRPRPSGHAWPRASPRPRRRRCCRQSPRRAAIRESTPSALASSKTMIARVRLLLDDVD